MYFKYNYMIYSKLLYIGGGVKPLTNGDIFL